MDRILVALKNNTKSGTNLIFSNRRNICCFLYSYIPLLLQKYNTVLLVYRYFEIFMLSRDIKSYDMKKFN